MADSAINPDLNELFQILNKQVAALSAALGKAKSSDEAQKILGQLMEVNHRQNRVGSLLFVQKVVGITKAMNKVRQGTAAANAAIAKITKITNFLKTTTKFLALVDRVIDTADAIMPV